MSSMEARLTLVFEDPGGNRHPVELEGPGGRIRLAVGEPGCRSGIWMVQAPQTKNDVYIAVESFAGTLKWSLHQSGSWRLQWGNRLRAWEFTRTDDRLISEWEPPKELGDSGWTQAFVINVRHRDIFPLEEKEPLTNDIIWVPPPRPDHSVAIQVIIARPNGVWLDLHNVMPFSGFMLADHRAVLLTRSLQKISEQEHNNFDRQIAEVLRKAAGSVDFKTLSSGRLLTIGESSDGSRSVWDLAVPQRDNG